MTSEVLVHGTAIVAGTTGYLFVGPSGSGKTKLALACLDGARRANRFAALIADDQVQVTLRGGHFIARCPPTIKGKAEIRGAAIVDVETIAVAEIRFAVRPTDPREDMRLAPHGENYTLVQDAMIPLLRLPTDCIDPWANLLRIQAAYKAEN